MYFPLRPLTSYFAVNTEPGGMWAGHNRLKEETKRWVYLPSIRTPIYYHQRYTVSISMTFLFEIKITLSIDFMIFLRQRTMKSGFSQKP